jgi:hypothetical protein
VKKHTFRWMIVSVLVVASTDAPAKPPAGGVFCQKYPTSPECMGRQPSCTYCHIAPPQRNAFGTMVSRAWLRACRGRSRMATSRRPYRVR